MKKKVHGHQVKPQGEHPIRWLPIDSRFITPIFKFGSVKGTARIFLEIEITLAIFTVAGTLLVAGMKVVELMIK